MLRRRGERGGERGGEHGGERGREYGGRGEEKVRSRFGNIHRAGASDWGDDGFAKSSDAVVEASSRELRGLQRQREHRKVQNDFKAMSSNSGRRTAR